MQHQQESQQHDTQEHLPHLSRLEQIKKTLDAAIAEDNLYAMVTHSLRYSEISARGVREISIVPLIREEKDDEVFEQILRYRDHRKRFRLFVLTALIAEEQGDFQRVEDSIRKALRFPAPGLQEAELWVYATLLRGLAKRRLASFSESPLNEPGSASEQNHQGPGMISDFLNALDPRRRLRLFQEMLMDCGQTTSFAENSPCYQLFRSIGLGLPSLPEQLQACLLLLHALKSKKEPQDIIQDLLTEALLRLEKLPAEDERSVMLVRVAPFFSLLTNDNAITAVFQHLMRLARNLPEGGTLWAELAGIFGVMAARTRHLQLAQRYFEKLLALAVECTPRDSQHDVLRLLAHAMSELQHDEEGQTLFISIVTSSTGITDTFLRACVFLSLAQAIIRQGELESGRELVSQAVAVASRLRQDEKKTLFLEQMLSEAYPVQIASSVLTQSLELLGTMGADWAQAGTLKHLTHLAVTQLSVEAVTEFLERLLQFALDLPDEWERTEALSTLAGASLQLETPAIKHAFLDRILSKVNDTADRWSKAEALGMVGQAKFLLGRFQDGRQIFEQAIDVASRISVPEQKTQSLKFLSNLVSVLRKDDTAQGLFAQIFAVAMGIGNDWWKVDALSTLARVVWSTGHHGPAGNVLGHGIMIATGISDSLEQVQALHLLGNVLLETGDLAAVRGSLSPLLDIAAHILPAPEKTEALLTLAQIIAELDDSAWSRTVLEQAIAVIPGIRHTGKMLQYLQRAAQLSEQLCVNCSLDASRYIDPLLPCVTEIIEPWWKREALCLISRIAANVGDSSLKYELLEQASNLPSESDAAYWNARVLHITAHVMLEAGTSDNTRALLERALAFTEGINDVVRKVKLYGLVVNSLNKLHEYEAARSLGIKAMNMAIEISNSAKKIEAMGFLAYLAARSSHHEKGWLVLEDLLSAASRIPDNLERVEALRTLGESAMHIEDRTIRRELLERTVVAAEKLIAARLELPAQPHVNNLDMRALKDIVEQRVSQSISKGANEAEAEVLSTISAALALDKFEQAEQIIEGISNAYLKSVALLTYILEVIQKRPKRKFISYLKAISVVDIRMECIRSLVAHWRHDGNLLLPPLNLPVLTTDEKKERLKILLPYAVEDRDTVYPLLIALIPFYQDSDILQDVAALVGREHLDMT